MAGWIFLSGVIWGIAIPGGGMTGVAAIGRDDKLTGAVTAVTPGKTTAGAVTVVTGDVVLDKLDSPNATALLATASIAWIFAVAAAAATKTE